MIVYTAGFFGPTELSNMMEESVTMAKFNHPNVMRLMGVCIDKGPSPYIVMPYMAYGSLLSYLKKHRVEFTLATDDDQELVSRKRLSSNEDRHKTMLFCIRLRAYCCIKHNYRSLHFSASFSQCVSKWQRGCRI